MARWLGIGRDGLDTSDVEAFHEEQIAFSDNKIPENNINNFIEDTDDPMTGISNFGYSLNTNEDFQTPLSTGLTDNTNESNKVNINSEIIDQNDILHPDLKAETSKSTAKKRKNNGTSKRVSKTRKSKNKSSVLSDNPSENVDLKKDEWEPDLSGWDVSYVEQ